MTTEFIPRNDATMREILTVTQLNQVVGGVLESNFPMIWVQGEISNFVAAVSGHWYFTLKDQQAAVRAVMFRTKVQMVGFTPKVGERLEISARVTLYEPRGDYQLQVECMRRAGRGTMYEAFIRLKEKLENLGLFDLSRKRVPKPLPQVLGVVTSLRAAALRDVLSVLARRAPHVKIIIYPAAVQGSEAPLQLANAVKSASQRAEVDTLLIVRGGGSIEDLSGFNDETLAIEIAQSNRVIITGIGHETDFTIADFVADLRAPTPTAAAELACLSQTELFARIGQAGRLITRAQRRRVDRLTQKLDLARARLIAPLQHITLQCERLNSSIRRLQRAQMNRLSLKNALLKSLKTQLRALDPRQTLARGYLIARDNLGKIVHDASELLKGESLELEFSRGIAEVRVETIKT